MKKQWFQKAMVTGLALMLTVGLCACGGGSEETGSKGESGGKGNANSALAKENVYQVNEFEIPQFVDDSEDYVNANAILQKDGKVYVLLRVQNWSKEDGSNQTELKLMSVNKDGSDVQIQDLEMPAQNRKSEQGAAEGGNATGEETSEGGTAAGEDTAEGATATGEEASEDTAVDGDFAVQPLNNVWEYTGYGNFAMSENGRIYGIREYNYEDYSNPDDYVSEYHQYVCSWDFTGSFLWETELEGLRTDEENTEYIYIRDMFVSKDGKLKLMLSGDNLYEMNVGEDGTVSEKKKLSDQAATILNNYQYIVPKGDGTFFVIYSDENDWTKTFMAEYDMESDTLGEPAEMPSNLTWNGFNTVTAGIGSDIVYSNSNGVYTYNKGDAEGTIRMNFVNSDVNITNFTGFAELDDKSFLGIYNENYDSELKAAIFTYVDPKDIPDKAVLVMACCYLDSDVKKRVVEYNRTSDAYRIVLKDYSSYITYDDYNAGTNQLNNDIITGNMPDILIADNLPIDNYISKGLVADVGKLIEEDEELSQVEFMQNVLDAYSVNGKLYYVIPKFNVTTMVAKKSLVGDGSDWSMDKMKQILDGMGEGTLAFGNLTRDEFMNTAMQFCGRDFIDIETGKCAFDSEDFIAMMEFAKTLPEEINWDEIYQDEGFNWESQYRDNKTLLLQLYISSGNGLSYQLNGYMGEDVTYVGFPTAEGSGSYINAYGSMVLSAKSKNLDGAWDFARYYLTDEYQESLDYCLPINKKCFMEEMQKATKRPTSVDYETQEEVEYDDTMYINGEEIIIQPLSQAQLDQLIQFVESVNTPYYYNMDVMNIINEEMGSFYSGQKTARDAAAIIQSRAQLYVDENR